MRGRVADFRQNRKRRGITPAYAGKSSKCDGFQWRRGDHPRVCGEEPPPVPVPRPPAGSPPRMRGRVEQLLGVHVSAGITPAYAGKRVPVRKIRRESRDHPRVCGEETTSSCGARKIVGSPPRMRGRVSSDSISRSDGRITPAYAGKSTAADWPNRSYKDHPRVCGEEAVTFTYALADQGSPPRMRGRAESKPICPAKKGITPAYAGKSGK